MSDAVTSLARLRELAEQLPRSDCPWEERPRFGPPARSELLDAIEQLTGCPMPADLRSFLVSCSEVVGMSVHNGYQIGVTERILHPLYRKALPATLVPATLDGRDGPQTALPIGSDGGGNAFLLTVPSGRVFQWNHETGQVTIVADTFGTFLVRVVADWEHYLADDHAWRFLV